MSSEILPETWKSIVESVPICSVDLLILRESEKFLLGKRTNKPAKGKWFVPGGRIEKNEGFHEAVNRISKDEVGLEVEIERRLGFYQHFYKETEVGAETGKHYVALCYVVRPVSNNPISDDQNSELGWFRTPPADCHKYTMTYLEDCGLI